MNVKDLQKIYKPAFTILLISSVILNLFLAATHPFVLSQLKRVTDKIQGIISPNSQTANKGQTLKSSWESTPEATISSTLEATERPTTAPTQRPSVATLAPTPFYTSHAGYPLINKVTDSLGNTNTNSWGKGTGGDWIGGNSANPTIKLGTAITFTVYASDPEDDEIQYRFRYTGNREGVILQDWSNVNTIAHTFDDAGDDPMIIVQIKDSNNTFRYTGEVDDYTYMRYKVQP